MTQREVCPHCGDLIHGRVIKESYRKLGLGKTFRCPSCNKPIVWDGGNWVKDDQLMSLW